jgi:hypothetical protein
MADLGHDMGNQERRGDPVFRKDRQSADRDPIPEAGNALVAVGPEVIKRVDERHEVPKKKNRPRRAVDVLQNSQTGFTGSDGVAMVPPCPQNHHHPSQVSFTASGWLLPPWRSLALSWQHG